MYVSFKKLTTCACRNGLLANINVLALKNAEFDSAGNVRDVASFNNTLKKKETLVLQLAGSYVKVSSIADVMMNDNLEQ